jgi:hypothetical protein
MPGADSGGPAGMHLNGHHNLPILVIALIGDDRNNVDGKDNGSVK